MSIKEKLDKNAQYLRQSREAIIGRGGEISSTAGWRDLPDAIYNIPIDLALAYQTDNSVEYSKTVPRNVLPVARINYIGGMTYKSTNLVPFPYENTSYRDDNTGFEISVLSDGGVVRNGYVETEHKFVLFEGRIDLEEGAYYYPSYCNIQLTGRDDRIRNELFKAKSGDYISQIFIITNPNTIMNNRLVYPQINKGTELLAYELGYGIRDTKVRLIYGLTAAGAGIDQIRISNEIQSIEGYGQGFSNKNNHIDFPRKKFVKEVHRLVFDGTEDIGMSNLFGDNYFSFGLPFEANPLYLVSTLYETKHYYNVQLGEQGIALVYEDSDPEVAFPAYSLIWCDRHLRTIEECKKKFAYLYEKGTPFTVYYALWTPVETDISQYLSDDNRIKVKAGGTIKLYNKYAYDVPSSITYLTKTAGE